MICPAALRPQAVRLEPPRLGKAATVFVPVPVPQARAGLAAKLHNSTEQQWIKAGVTFLFITSFPNFASRYGVLFLSRVSYVQKAWVGPFADLRIGPGTEINVGSSTDDWSSASTGRGRSSNQWSVISGAGTSLAANIVPSGPTPIYYIGATQVGPPPA